MATPNEVIYTDVTIVDNSASIVAGIQGVQGPPGSDALPRAILTGIQITGSSPPNTGLFNISNAGDIRVYLSGNNVIISGSSAAAGAGEANTASNLGNGSGLFSQKAGVDLQFKSLITSSDLQITGDSSRLAILLTGNLLHTNEFGTLSGNLNTTGFYLENRDNLISGQLNATGTRLDNKINSLSGYLNNNTGDFITKYQTGGFVDIGKTGGFADAGNLITTGNYLRQKIDGLSGQFNISGNLIESKLNLLSGNLQSTGNNLQNQILSLSGAIDTGYCHIKITGMSGCLTGWQNFTGGGNVSLIMTTGLSGLNFVIFSGNTGFLSNYVDLTTLTNSGNIIVNKIDSLSGSLNSSGIGLYNALNSLSGASALAINTGDFVVTSKTGGLADAGNLVNTGNYLRQKIDGLSGQFNISGINLYTLATNQITGISVTGSNSQIGLLNITSQGGTILYLSGNNMVISGGAGGGGTPTITPTEFGSLSGNLQSTGSSLVNTINSLSGKIPGTFVTGIQVSGSNGITGLANFTIAGDLRIFLSGQNVIISGSQTPPGGGEANTASNLGNGSGWFYTKSTFDLQFKSLIVGDNLTISGDNNILLIRPTGLTLDQNTGNFIVNSQTGVFADKYNLITTGDYLRSKIDGLSGQFNISGINLYTNIQNTGNTLSNYINSLSGNLMTGYCLIKVTGMSGVLTGYQNFTGLGNVYLISTTGLSGIQFLYFSGDTGAYSNFVGTSSTGNFIVNSQTGNFADKSNLITTGDYLNKKIDGLSGQFNLSGNIIVNKIDSLSGNLNSTGISLFNRESSLSGSLDATGTSLKNQIFTLSGAIDTGYCHIKITGQSGCLTGYQIFSGVGNVSLISTTGLSGLNFVLWSGDTGAYTNFVGTSTTGNFIVNSQTGNFADKSNLITTGDYLRSKIDGLSGQFNLSGNIIVNKIDSLSGSLNNTGIGLYNQINSLSGMIHTNDLTGLQTTGSPTTLTSLVNLTHAGDIRLFQSGQNVIISGTAGAGTATITPAEFGTLSGNLVTTGSFLEHRIDSLSGLVNSQLTGLQVTGSPTTIVGLANISHAGTTRVFGSGQNIIISGAPSSAGGGNTLTITGSAELAGTVNFSIAGSSRIYLSGASVIVSGSDATSSSGPTLGQVVAISAGYSTWF